MDRKAGVIFMDMGWSNAAASQREVLTAKEYGLDIILWIDVPVVSEYGCPNMRYGLEEVPQRQ